MRRQRSFKGGWLSVSVCVYVLQYITYVHLKKMLHRWKVNWLVSVLHCENTRFTVFFKFLCLLNTFSDSLPLLRIYYHFCSQFEMSVLSNS